MPCVPASISRPSPKFFRTLNSDASTGRIKRRLLSSLPTLRDGFGFGVVGAEEIG